MKQYELLIFDWDGTLMDSIGKIVSCMQHTAAALDVIAPSERAIRNIIGLSMTKALKVLFPEGSEQDYQRMIDIYRQQYLQLNTTPSPLFEGTESLLLELGQEGYQLAVATGKARAGLNRVLGETGLGHHFVASRCADEAHSKPHPQMINQLLTELDVAPQRAVMIGDSIHDLNMANNAGIDAIGVDYGAHTLAQLQQAKPKAVISTPRELLHHL